MTHLIIIKAKYSVQLYRNLVVIGNLQIHCKFIGHEFDYFPNSDSLQKFSLLFWGGEGGGVSKFDESRTKDIIEKRMEITEL